MGRRSSSPVAPPTLSLSAQPCLSSLTPVSGIPLGSMNAYSRAKETLESGVEEGVVQVLARPELPHLALGELLDPQLARGMVGPTPVEPVNVDRPAIERTATSRDPARVEAAEAGPSFVPFRNGRSWQSCDRLPVARLFNCCVLLPLVVCFPAEAVAVSNLDTPPPSFSSPNTRSHATHTTQDLESPRRSISVSKIADTRTRWWWVLPLSSPPPVVVAGRLGLVVASESKIAPSSSTC